MSTVSNNVLQLRVVSSGTAQAGAEFARLNAGLRVLQTRAVAAGVALRSVGAGLSRAVGATARVGLVGLGVAAAGATAAILKATGAAREYVDALDKLSGRTGIAVGNLAVLQQVFSLTGAGAENVGKSVSKMLDSIAEAETNKKLADTFREIGVSLEELRNLNPEEQFRAIGKGIVSLADPARETAAAMEIFGISGAKLLVTFKDAGAFETARQQVGGMVGVLERSSKLFTEINDTLDGLHLKMVQFGAGFMETAILNVEAFSRTLNAIDLTELGHRVGTFFRIVAESIRDGTFSELVSDSLSLGFELGLAKGRELLGAFFSSAAVGSAVVGFSHAISNAIVSGALKVVPVLTAAATYFADQLGTAFNRMSERVGTFFADQINKQIDAINTLFGTSFNRVSVVPFADADKSARAFADHWQDATDEAEAQLREFRAFLESESASFRQSVGLSVAGPDGADMDERMRRWRARWAASEAENARVFAQRTADAAAAQERLSKAREESRRAEAAATAEAIRKLAEENERLAEKTRALDKIEAAQRRILSTYPGSQQARFAGFENQRRTESEMGMGAGAGALAGMQEALEAFGTLSEQVSRVMLRTIGGAIDGISEGIAGLIRGTLTWGAALAHIGSSIMNGIIDAISRMFAEWIVGIVLRNTVERAQAGATAAAKAPVALMDSISSFGIAAALGGAAFLAAMALAGGFESGGYTGDTAAGQPAGIVHGREFVFAAPVTARLGREDLDALHRGEASITRADAPGAGPVSVGVFDSRAPMEAWLRSGAGRAVVLDVVRKHRHEFV